MTSNNYSFSSNSPKISLILLSTTLTTLTLLFLFQSQSLKQQSIPFITITTTNTTSNSSTKTATFISQLRDSIAFLPLKDVRYTEHKWFMSSVEDIQEDDTEPQHLLFPSNSSKNRLLCLSARHHFDGTKNHYALAYRHALPYNSTLLLGLTVVSDTLYDYGNLWHGLGAIVPSVAWHEKNMCARPERWVLFHWGELRSEMGKWVTTLAEVTIGSRVRIENFAKIKNENVCFEKAVVFRHNEGGLGTMRRQQVYDMMRCKSRNYCNVSLDVGDVQKIIRVTVLLRVGGRAFKNDTAVVEVFERECTKFEGCVFKVARTNNLTFCDQVKLLSETDVLVSAHGAQMTNMIFMDKNSSVLEFFPKGWLEFAGVGQYVFQWMADWSGMRHQGQWKEQEGEKCPFNNDAACFDFYKDGKIGHDEAYFTGWMAKVLKEVKQLKSSSLQKDRQSTPSCPCS